MYETPTVPVATAVVIDQLAMTAPEAERESAEAAMTATIVDFEIVCTEGSKNNGVDQFD